MHITMRQAKLLHDACRQLDGWEDVVEIDGVQKVLLRPYALTFQARVAVADVLVALDPKVRALENHRKDLVRTYSQDGSSVADESVQNFRDQMKQILEEVVDVPLGKIRVADLGESSPIPPSVLAGLGPLLKEEEAVAHD